MFEQSRRRRRLRPRRNRHQIQCDQVRPIPAPGQGSSHQREAEGVTYQFLNKNGEVVVELSSDLDEAIVKSAAGSFG